jgi:glycosyltransferase involved in cell wall biosynthesis
MSVYANDSYEYLMESLQSIINQSLPPDEIVLVLDGPLSPKLESVIRKFEDYQPSLVKVIRLEKNKGLSNALAIGLAHTSYDIVARMDADDVCKPMRFKKQVEFLKANPDIDILGSWIDEFIDNTDDIVSSRRVPQYHDEIYYYMKTRCAINHPTVMFRKKAVLDAGNYDKRMRLRQDYDLWIRLLAKGYKFANLQESLLFFRTSPAFYKRRGGLKVIKYDYLIQKQLLRHNLINYFQFCVNNIIYGSARLSPSIARSGFYKILRRK